MSKSPKIPKAKPVMAPRRKKSRFKTCTVGRAKAHFDRLLADVEAGCVIEITRRGRAVASMLSTAMLETLEILANPDAMRVLRPAMEAKAAKGKKPKAGRGV